jgi:hypothetical protein
MTKTASTLFFQQNLKPHVLERGNKKYLTRISDSMDWIGVPHTLWSSSAVAASSDVGAINPLTWGYHLLANHFKSETK